MSDTPSSTPQPDPVRRRRTLIIVIAAIAVVVIVAIILSLSLRGGATSVKPTGSSTPTASDSASPEPSDSADPEATDEPSETPTDPADAVPTAAPIPLDEVSEAIPELQVSVEKLTAVEGAPQGAGEVAGPAIRFLVTMKNNGSSPKSLTGTVVNLYYSADDSPASSVTGPDGFALPNEVAAGDTVSGAYVFTVPTTSRDRIVIEVDYAAGSPVVLFEGPGPQ